MFDDLDSGWTQEPSEETVQSPPKVNDEEKSYPVTSTATWYYGFRYRQSYQCLSSTSEERRDTPGHRTRSWAKTKVERNALILPMPDVVRGDYCCRPTVNDSLAADFSFFYAVHGDRHRR